MTKEQTGKTAFLYFGGTKVIGCVCKSRAEADYAGICDGEFVDANELADVLPQTLETAISGFAGNIDKVIIGVPTQFCDVQLRAASLNFEARHKITAKDIRQLLGDGSAVYYKVDNGRAVIDAIGMEANHLYAQVSTVTIDDKFKKITQTALQDLRLKIEFIPQPLAEALYLVDEDIRDSTCTIIQSCLLSTSVIVVSGDCLVGVQSFNEGIAHIIDDIRVALKISFDAAKALTAVAVLGVAMGDNDNYQINVGGKDQKFAAAKVNEIIKKRMEVIAGNIKDILNSADPKLLNNPVLICGGYLDAISGARNFLSKILDIHIRQCADPLTEENIADEIGLKSLINFCK